MAVTVTGADGGTQSLDFSSINLATAQQVAAQINSEVGNGPGQITPVADPITGGDYYYDNGQSQVPSNAAAFVDNDTSTATTTTITGAGDRDGYDVLVGGTGNVNLTIADSMAGSGNVVLGDGNNMVNIASGNPSPPSTLNYNISVGNGTNAIGIDNINTDITTGAGNNLIALTGQGDHEVTPLGASTIFGSAGNDTVSGALGGNLEYIGAPGGNAVVFGGLQSDNTFVVAAAGNETLRGGATLGVGTDTFNISNAASPSQFGPPSPRNVTINNFTPGSDHVALTGYAATEVPNAIANAQTSGGSTMVKLTDGTTVTFTSVSALDPTFFKAM